MEKLEFEKEKEKLEQTIDIVYTGEVSKPLENHLKNIQKQLNRKKVFN